MYVGVNKENGNRIPDREAFGYASERCLYGTDEEKQTFMELLKDSENIEEFSEILVEWFYSGDWVYDPHDNGNKAGLFAFQTTAYTGAIVLMRML